MSSLGGHGASFWSLSRTQEEGVGWFRTRERIKGGLSNSMGRTGAGRLWSSMVVSYVQVVNRRQVVNVIVY